MATMKTWGFWVKALKATGVTVLISGLWFLASFRGLGKSEGQPEVRVSPAGNGTSNSARTKQDPKWAEAFGRLPLGFEENVGQATREVRFVSHGTGYGLFLTPQEAVISLEPSMARNLSPLHRMAYFRALRKAHQAGRMTVLRMGLEGANPAAEITGVDRLPGKVNYFIGNNPKEWHTDVPAYARVKYTGIYAGVDLMFYGNQSRLEYDFAVAPGADPKVIELSLKGAENLRINSQGDLIMSVSGGRVALQKPVIYQTVRGDRHEIQGRYVLAGSHRVTLAIAKYDRNEPLIVDPVLDYSTYLGGSATGDLGSGIAVDSLGDAFVTGTTFSTTFPSTPGGFGAGNTNGVAFVTEINPTGTSLLYTTYLGGTGGDFGLGIALDNSGSGANPGGNVYVAGETFSTDFPTNGSVTPLKAASAGAAAGTSFISKINPAASGIASLVYSSYLGGTGGTNPDVANGVAADVNGNAYVTGLTSASPGTAPANFPITAASAFQTTLGTTNGNAFVTRINTTQSGSNSLAYSTYLGGSGANAGTSGLGLGETGQGVTVGASENAYIVGVTTSTDFPTTNANAFQKNTAPPAAVAHGTVFVSRVDTSTTKAPAASLVYSTYLGGEGQDLSTKIALKPNSTVAYVTGVTTSLLFPILPTAAPGPFQTTGATGGTAFVSLIDTQNGPLLYSTFLGPAATEAFDIAADAAGNAYVVGGTSASTFPVTRGAFQPAFAPGAQGEGFVSKINPGGNGAADLDYSSFFGGTGSAGGPDSVNAIALDSQNNAYITGVTFSSSATFPVFPLGAFQTTLIGLSDAFIAKLTLIPTLVVSPAPGSTLAFGTVLIGTTSPAQTVTLTNNTNAAIAFTSAVVNGSPAAANTDYAVTNSCSGSIPFGAANTCTVSVTFKPTVVGAETATLQLTDNDSTSPQNILLTGTGANPAPAVMLAPTSLAFGNQQLNMTSTAQIVTLTNTGTGPLTINTIAASGDFAETSTGATACPISPATLAAGANCKISVTFTPTALGARAGTLTITDNAAGNPHTVPLTGTGTNTPDFTITATAPAPSPVKAGSPATFTVTVTPIGGFNSAVTIACVEPAGLNLSTCTPTTSPITPNGAAVSTLVTVTTTAPSLMVPPPSMPTRPLRIWQIVPLLLALILLFLLPTAKRLRLRLGMAAATLALLALAGCTGPGTPKKPGTTPGTYSLTVTGTAGATMHTVTPAPSVTVN
jgi:hypothetical protein